MPEIAHGFTKLVAGRGGEPCGLASPSWPEVSPARLRVFPSCMFLYSASRLGALSSPAGSYRLKADL